MSAELMLRVQDTMQFTDGAKRKSISQGETKQQRLVLISERAGHDKRLLQSPGLDTSEWLTTTVPCTHHMYASARIPGALSA